MNDTGICAVHRRIRCRLAGLALLAACIPAAAQQTALQLDPAHTTVHFTLGGGLHTVHGTFKPKRSALQLDASAGKLTGEIVVDATSGESGNGSRDHKMHREILESERYPDIAFRPDRVEGSVGQGKSTVQVHGMFSIHGADHEITVPADVEMASDHWSAVIHFNVPYVKWGLKNPSNFFLRVDDSVQIDLETAGTLSRLAPAAQTPAQ